MGLRGCPVGCTRLMQLSPFGSATTLPRDVLLFFSAMALSSSTSQIPGNLELTLEIEVGLGTYGDELEAIASSTHFNARQAP